MDVAEFEDLLGRHGENVSLWPDSRRAEAIALLRTSEQARALIADAELLRRALQAEPVRAPEGLVDRIMRKARESDQAAPDRAKKPDNKS